MKRSEPENVGRRTFIKEAAAGAGGVAVAGRQGGGDAAPSVEARFDDVQADIRVLRALVIDAIQNGDPAD